jgi:hypothetical protein
VQGDRQAVLHSFFDASALFADLVSQVIHSRAPLLFFC